MTKQEADEKLEIISRLAREIEEDPELFNEDERYSICAMWIDTDINNVSV